jgi:geranylgeranyl diphosphate synthase, type II
MSAEAIISAYRERVDARLSELLPLEDQEPTQLSAAMRYSALAPGKRLRPALCMASARAVGAAPDAALDAACALELVHCFSLIHDDLPAIDDDDLRRGMPTCHKQFGEAIALLAGDALFALAFEVLAHSRGSSDRVLRSVLTLARATGAGGLVGGEVVDVLSEGTDFTEHDVRMIHARKTGALISAACQIGGLLGGGDEEQNARLTEYGEHVGLAFQIADDLLNELSTPEQLGKAAGSDRLRRKATFPALHGVEASREAARYEVERALERLHPIASDELAALAWYSVDRLS